MKITVEEALIRTATIEVKSMTVSGRQVTQALFRQFDSESLVDYQVLRLNGLLWGRVNYHYGACEQEGRHLHLVWQAGTELHRDVIRLHDRRMEGILRAFEQSYREAGEVALNSHVLDTKLNWSFPHGAECLTFTIAGIKYERYCSPGRTNEDRVGKLLFARSRPDQTFYHLPEGQVPYKLEITKIEEELRKRVKPDAYSAFQRAEEDLTKYRASWAELYGKLEAVQQLFIAC